MGTRIRQRLYGVGLAAKTFWRWLTLPFIWLGQLPLLRPLWQLLGRMGLALRNLWVWFVWEPILIVVIPAWRFLGGMGLALRQLLITFLWRPFVWVARPVWHLMGQVGLALRYGLTWVVWKPLRLLVMVVLRVLQFLWQRILAPILRWLYQRWQRLAQALWRYTAPRRALWRRRLNSWWFIRLARWRTRLLLRRPPVDAIIAPKVPRSVSPRTRRLQLTTAFISATVLILMAFVIQQERQQTPVVTRTTFRLPSFNVSLPAVPAAVAPTSAPMRATATPWPTPDPLDEGGSVAFSWHQNGNSDLYILTVGRSEPLRLTSHPAPDVHPVWSPNGQEIAFSSHRDGNWEIYIYDLATAELRRMTNNLAFDGQPRWSPDGKWLVYESYEEENMDIQIVRADLESGPFRLTRHQALDYAPVWAPGGRHIAFTSWRSGNPDIFVISLDAAADDAAVNLTNSPDKYEDQPTFSPDGRFLAYQEESNNFSLISTLPLTPEFRPAGPAITTGQQGRHPAWSPNGEALFYIFDQGPRSHLIAGRLDAWGVTPQAFTVDGRIDHPNWTAVTLTPQLAGHLFSIDQVSSIDPITADNPLYIEALAPTATVDPELEAVPVTVRPALPANLLWEVPVNAPAPYLNDRIDQSYLALRQRVIETAGWDFLGQLDNMFEPLDRSPLPGQSFENWNQAGRAFDLPYRDALAFEPLVEIVREDFEGQTYWRVFLRTEAQDGSQGQPLRQRPWDFRARFGDDPQYYDDGGKLKEMIPPGYYVDFTALAADYGWNRVPATSNWRTYFPAIRFWHFENRQGLNWQEAMRELYTEDELSAVLRTP